MSAKAAAKATNTIGQFRAQLDQAMAQLADTRAEVGRLRSELELAESRPVPPEVVEERAAATVERLRGFLASQVSTGDLFSRQWRTSWGSPGQALCLALRRRGHDDAERGEEMAGEPSRRRHAVSG
jgi:hypothetical protein